jgi:hypothetical protein
MQLLVGMNVPPSDPSAVLSCVYQILGTPHGKMKILLTLALIASAVLYFAPNFFDAGISPAGAALLVIAFVAIFAWAESRRTGFISALLRIGLTVGAIAVFVISRSGGDRNRMVSLIGGLAMIVIVLYGIYVMLGGPTKSRRRRKQDD